jgi:hypothetical protein
MDSVFLEFITDRTENLDRYTLLLRFLVPAISAA